MDLTRPSSGHDQTEDLIKIHHPEEEEYHESRASRMLGKVKAKAKKLKNRLTKHGIDGNEHGHDVVDEEDDESDELEPEKHVEPVNEVSNVKGYETSQPEPLSHPQEVNVLASSSETKDSTTVYSSDHTGGIEPEHKAPSYPVRTSDVSDREENRETQHETLNTPVSLLSATEDVTTPGEDGLLGGQREVDTDRPKRLEDDLSGESTYQSRIPYHTQQGSGEAGKDDEKSGLGTELEFESRKGKDSPVRFGGESETELGKYLPTRSFESEIGNASSTVLSGKEETGPRDDFPAKSHQFDQKIQYGTGDDGGKPETELREDFSVKRREFEQTIESGIGSGKPGTERREDFLGKSYEFDQEIESLVGKDSPTRLGGDEIFPTRSDDMKVNVTTETDERDDLNSQAMQTRYEAEEPKPTTYTEMNDSEIDKAIAPKNESHVGDDSVAEKLTTDYEHVKQTASLMTTKLPLSGDGNGAEETEQEEDKGVPTRDHLEEKLTPDEEEEDKAFSAMVAEKLDLGGEEKKTTTTNKVEVAMEKIRSHELSETEHGELVEEEGNGGGGIVGKIKGVYNYWLGGTTEEMKPKSPNSGEESTQSTVGTKGFLDSGESPLGETGGSTGAVPQQKGV